MLKKNKKAVILSCLVILLPLLAGLLIWNRLPEEMPCHWNFQGEADDWCSKPFGVFFLPLFFLGVQLFLLLVVAMDPKKKNLEGKVSRIVIWMVPLLAVTLVPANYVLALGVKLSMNSVVGIVMGLMFIAVGNYLPKSRKNYTLGYRTPWALESEDNWIRTHRLAGKLLIAGGVLLFLSAFVGFFEEAMMAAVVLALIPAGYSFWYYHTHGRSE